MLLSQVRGEVLRLRGRVTGPIRDSHLPMEGRG